MRVKHPFTSPKADGPNSTLVRPSAWNADHEVTTEAPSVYLGRQQAGAGPVQELPVEPQDVTDNGTMWTAAKVQAHVAAAIAAAVAAVPVTPLGTIVGSINGNMPGFLPLNGTSFGPVGSGATHMSASYQALFTHIWSVIPTYPITPSRGASAAADWAALKRIVLPSSAGHTLGAAGSGVMSAPFLSLVGEASHVLTEAEMPVHAHSLDVDGGQNLGGGVTGSANVLQETVPGPLTTTPAGSGAAHNNIQPTLIMQVWWIKY